MKKTKRKVPKLLKPVAVYTGDTEKYFPSFKIIVNKGDIVTEMPLDEAKARRDFVVIYKEDKK